MLDELTAWLQAPRYAVGCALYSRLPNASAFYCRLFASGADAYNQKKLHELLEQALRQEQSRLQVQHERYPVELKADLARGKQLMDVRQAIKERIRTLHDQQADEALIRQEAFRILSITDELTVIYGQKRFVDKNGYLPEPTTHDTDTREALVLRRNSVRTYVSRIAGQIAKASDDGRRATLETRLAGFKSELLDIENRLAELT